MIINIGYAVILTFHNFQLRGQTKVAYIKSSYKNCINCLAPDCLSGAEFGVILVIPLVSC